MNKNNQAYQNLDEILLRMKYDLKKTLNENKKNISEQPSILSPMNPKPDLKSFNKKLRSEEHTSELQSH